MKNLPKIVVALVLAGCFFASAQQPAKKSTASTSDAEARKHYKIALAALQNNDLATAEDELRMAAQLTPRNPLIYYNLAVVAEKRGDIHGADESLAKAEHLHLPADVKDQAETLRGEIDYKLQQESKQAAVQQEAYKRLAAFNWLFGTWEAEPDRSADSYVSGLLNVSTNSNSLSGHWHIIFVLKIEKPPFPMCFEDYDITNVRQSTAVDIVIDLELRKKEERGDPDYDMCLRSSSSSLPGASATLLMHRNDDGSLSGP